MIFKYKNKKFIFRINLKSHKNKIYEVLRHSSEKNAWNLNCDWKMYVQSELGKFLPLVKSLIKKKK